MNIWKRLFIGLLICIIVATVAFAIAVQVFHQSGIHFLGPAVYIQIAKKCYIMDNSGFYGNFVGESELQIEGYAYGTKFVGSLNIDAFPLSAYEALETGIPIGGNGDILVLTAYGIDHNHTTNDWTRYYTIRILKKDPDAIVIEIREKDGDFYRAVCGESEEDALENYRIYQDYFEG